MSKLDAIDVAYDCLYFAENVVGADFERFEKKIIEAGVLEVIARFAKLKQKKFGDKVDITALQEAMLKS